MTGRRSSELDFGLFAQEATLRKASKWVSPSLSGHSFSPFPFSVSFFDLFFYWLVQASLRLSHYLPQPSNGWQIQPCADTPSTFMSLFFFKKASKQTQTGNKIATGGGPEGTERAEVKLEIWRMGN